MKKYNLERMAERLLNKIEEHNANEICVWDFPNYDEHFVSEIEGILDIVAECLETDGYKVNRRKAPKCGWGMASYAMVSVER